MLAGTASLAGTAATATHTGSIVGRGSDARVVGARGGNIGIRAKVRVRLDIGTALVGLLGHLEHLAELHALVGLHRLLNVREPLVCHFV